MNTSHAYRLAVWLALCLGSGQSGAADREVVEVGVLRIQLPAGWVRVDAQYGPRSWFNVAPLPNRAPQCRVSMVPAGFGVNLQAFKEGWATAASILRWNTALAPPVPLEFKLPGGLIMRAGAYAVPPGPGILDYVAVANIATKDFGQAFAAMGTRAVCEAAFDAMVAGVVVVDDQGTAAGSRGADGNALSTLYANGQRDDQRRAAQGERDRQEQDRQARQRELDRQQQDRLARQRELDQQQQDRLAQQREMDRIAQQRYR